MRVHLFPPYRQQLTTDGAPSEHTRGTFMLLIDHELALVIANGENFSPPFMYHKGQ